jgi:guanosine-3',5'-bis(diphosphate) 3'-pyrophosphohydrolase
MNEAFVQAVLFAVKKHANQTRKLNGEPYVCHPIRVAMLLFNRIGPLFSAPYQAAVLHDVLEDTDTTFEELEATFGREVAMLVRELTNDKLEIARLGKTEYLRVKMIQLSENALSIKLCDRYDNINDLPPAHTQNEWANNYAQQTYVILKDLAFFTELQCFLNVAIKERLRELGYIQN